VSVAGLGHVSLAPRTAFDTGHSDLSGIRVVVVLNLGISMMVGRLVFYGMVPLRNSQFPYYVHELTWAPIS
jgi:hypothetical protein